MTFREISAKLREWGPDRVVINAEGEATTSRRARREHHIHPVIIFVRDDGWMLGAPAHLIPVAEKMWEREWAAVVEQGSFEPISYADWKAKQCQTSS